MSRVTAALAALLLAATAPALAEEPVPLLRQAGVQLVGELPAAERGALASWLDGDPRRGAALAGSAAAPRELVFDLGRVVTARELVVHPLPGRPEDSSLARVVAMGSTLSPTAGFRLLRAADLAAEGSQRFAFAPQGVRYLLLRLTPARGHARVAVGELSLRGKAGPPAPAYAFKDSPVAVVELLAQLRQEGLIGGKATAADSEAALLSDAADGKLDDHTLAQAALIVSGLTDARAHPRALERLAALEQGAREALAALPEGADAFARGRRLLEWLHDKRSGPLRAGYRSLQSSLPIALERGHHNCVSAAVLYLLLGRRLGLDVRGVQVPSHAFAIVYDGTRHADVEATSGAGFDPARNEVARRAFSQRTGFRYIPEAHPESRRETSSLGLVALIRMNRAIGDRDAGRHAAALGGFAATLTLDPANSAAAQSTLALLSRWGVALAAKGKFAEAARLINLGCRLAPEHASLRHNRKVIYQRWLMARARAGASDEALTIARRARELDPADAKVWRELEAWVFIEAADREADRGRWSAAAAIAQRGLERADPAAHPKLLRARQRFWMNGSLALIQRQRWIEVQDLLTAALKVVRDDARRRQLTGQLRAATDSARQALAAKGDHATSIKLYRRALTTLPDDAHLERNLAAAWDGQARVHLGAQRWSKALAVYLEALAEVPRADVLTHNAAVALDRHLRQLLSKGADPAAAELARVRQLLGADHPTIQRVTPTFAQLRALRLRDEQRYDEAITAAATAFRGTTRRDLIRTLTDAHADQLARRDLPAAAAAYARGLKLLPRDKHLRHNSAITHNTWARQLLAKGDVAGALKVYDQGLKLSPSSGLLKTNRKIAARRR